MYFTEEDARTFCHIVNMEASVHCFVSPTMKRASTTTSEGIVTRSKFLTKEALYGTAMAM